MKPSIKVTYLGETKRIKKTNTYGELTLLTRQAFGSALEKVQQIKFYYLDDEQELISVSTQADLLEALSIEDVGVLKLTVATSASDARQQFEKTISETVSFTESLNQSQRFSMPPLNFGQQLPMRMDTEMSDIR